MNNTMVREIRGAKTNAKSSFKNQGAQNTRWRKLREQIRYYQSLYRDFVLHSDLDKWPCTYTWEWPTRCTLFPINLFQLNYSLHVSNK